jgi:hypothetical protein
MFAATAGGFAACTRSSARSNEAAAQTAGTPKAATAATHADAASDKVIVYYFHGTRRCPTCLGIQETIARTISERFGAETASGALAFKVINFEEPENKHFVEEYSLGFSTMIIVANQGQTILKWENFKKVWDYALNPEALTEYTEKGVRAYLAMLKGN